MKPNKLQRMISLFRFKVFVGTLGFPSSNIVEQITIKKQEIVSSISSPVREWKHATQSVDVVL